MVQKSKLVRPARNAILDAARRLFESKDFIAVTLDEVARKAGVSRQAVYVNFGSRAGLLVALVGYVDEIGGLQVKIAKVLDSPTALGALEALVDFRARYAPSIFRLATHVDAARRFDADAEAADLIWSLTSIRTYEDLVVDRGWSLSKYRQRVKAILVGAIVG